MRVVVLAHPRSGTMFAAHCFQRAGWDVGHEVRGKDGISSWSWAVDGTAYYGVCRKGPLPGIVLHILREPAACVSSVAETELGSMPWRRKWIEIPDARPIERAVWSIYGWNELIRRECNPTHTTQLRDIRYAVYDITGRVPDPLVGFRNDRPHRVYGADEIKATPWKCNATAQLWDRLVTDYEAAA